MKNYPIGTKLFGAFGAIFVLTVVLASTSYWTVSNMQTSFDHTTKVTVQKLILTGDIDKAESDMFAAQRGMIMNAFDGRMENLEATRQAFEKSSAEAEKALEELRPLLVTEEGKRLYSTITQGVAQWKPLFSEIRRECEARRPAEAVKISDKVAPIYQSLGKEADNLNRINAELMSKEQGDSDSHASTARVLCISLMVLAFAVGGLVFYVVRQITHELKQVAGAMGQGAEQVASASTQVANSSQALAQGSSEQAASLEETSASAEEITSMTRKNADNSRHAAELMTEVDRHVTGGNKTLDQMVGSMHSINESSEKVSRIIKVIDEIAFQTNILALNAAVEAARAGEAGMGFAVVADEVRSLAQRSAQAAKDTAALIEESISRSKEGSTNLESVAGVIRSITDSASKVKTLVDEVNLGSQEQARGIEQIAKAITQMDQVTQQNAANAEESASASHELSAQAESMRENVNQLQAMIGGASEKQGRKHHASAMPVHAHAPSAAKPKASHAPAHHAPSPGAGTPDFSFDDFKDF